MREVKRERGKKGVREVEREGGKEGVREVEREGKDTHPMGDFSPAASACRGNTKEPNRPLRRPSDTECLLSRDLFEPSRFREEELLRNFGGTDTVLLVSRGGFESFVATGAALLVNCESFVATGAALLVNCGGFESFVATGAAGALGRGTLDWEEAGLDGMERRSALR